MTVAIAEARELSNQSSKQCLGKEQRMRHILPAAEQGWPVAASHHTWAIVSLLHQNHSKRGFPLGFGFLIQIWGAGPFLGENTGIQHLFWTWILYKSMVVLGGRDRAKNQT